MCIKRNIIWDQYLLRSESPILQILNQFSYAWIQDYNIESTYNTDVRIALSYAGHSDDSSFFQWVPDDEVNSLRWGYHPRNNPEQQVEDRKDWGRNYSSLKINCKFFKSRCFHGKLLQPSTYIGI